VPFASASGTTSTSAKPAITASQASKSTPTSTVSDDSASATASAAALDGTPVATTASDNNNVCQNGAHTKKQFKSCYDNDAAARALYNSLGITAAGIAEATTTTICADQGYSSYGHNPTADSIAVNPDGQSFFKRPLGSVMKGCASAWKVRTKNGYVMVLKFCGNPETKGCSCSPPKHHAKSVAVSLLKKLSGGTYTGLFTFKVTIGAKQKTVQVSPNKRKLLGHVNRGTKVKITEVNIPQGWTVQGSKTVTKTFKASGTVTFTNVWQTPAQPTTPGCNAQQQNATNSGNACQGIQAPVTANPTTTAAPNCPGNPVNSTVCPITQTTIIHQVSIPINAVCSKVTIIFSDDTTKVEFHDNNNNVVTEQYCSSQSNTTTPPATVTYSASANALADSTASATVNCPSGSASATATASGSAYAIAGAGSATSTVSQQDADTKAQQNANAAAAANAKAAAYANAQANASALCKQGPPPPPADHAPQITCVYPAHVYVKDSAYVWCNGSDSDKDQTTVTMTGGAPYGHISGVTPQSIQWDGSTCPATVNATTCWRGQFWGDQVTPNGTYSRITSTVSANGKSTNTFGDIPVFQDDFGSGNAAFDATTIQV
jgi:hypothetical protein